MGLFKSKKGSIISEMFQVSKEVGALTKGNLVDVALYDDYLEIKQMFPKQEITLKYEKITDVFFGNQEEIIEKNKSVIGRAAVGGLLFGGAGAVVGAMTANGKKEKKVISRMFIISYKNASGEDDFLAFEDTRMYKGKKLAATLAEIIGVSIDPKKADKSIEL